VEKASPYLPLEVLQEYEESVNKLIRFEQQPIVCPSEDRVRFLCSKVSILYWHSILVEYSNNLGTFCVIPSPSPPPEGLPVSESKSRQTSYL
jgi:hypothetical protein